MTLEEDGQPLTGRAVQKRRLALLALLATARGRTMSRDKVMGILWPEKTEEQARHLVSVAAYEIRKELGEDVLISRGDDLTLDPVLLETDVEAFDQALEAGDREHAASLRSGPFLDGFHLGESVEFDQWADQEREARERAYRRALETLAEEREAAGDRTGAVDMWKKLAAEDRFNSRVATRLVRALGAAGNPAGAVRFARVHTALLQGELDTEPPPEFTAALDAVKGAGDEPPAAVEDIEPVPAVTADAPEATTMPREAEPAADHAGSSVGTGPVDGNSGAGAEPPWSRALSWAGGRPSPSIVRLVVATVLVLMVGAVGGYLAIAGITRGETVGIAVLPFHPMSSDESAQAFADGLTEQIMEVLGGVGEVRMPARSASFAMRGIEAGEAARRLDVDYILEGSVRRENDRLRIRAELSGPDGFNEWSHVYNLAVGDVFATWDEIAAGVLTAVEVELQGQGVPSTDGGTEDLAAFDLYLKGRHAWFKRTPDGFGQALHYFQAAVDRDPRYARAHTGIADVFNLLGAYDYSVLPPEEAFPLAKAAAERALTIAPDLAGAHAALANTLFAYDRDMDAAEEAYRRAIDLSPRYAEARHWYALFLMAQGRSDEAIRESRQALALDSVSVLMRTSYGRQLYYRGDYEGALEQFETALALEPNYPTTYHALALTLVQLGRAEEAVGALDKVLDMMPVRAPNTLGLLGYAHASAGQREEARALLAELEAIEDAGHYVGPEFPAIIHLGLGDEQRAIDYLEAALRLRSSSLAFLNVEPLVRPLEDQPRFQRLKERVKGL